MKILWFTNTACSASDILYPGHNRGGWLSSLEKELSVHNEIDLHIAFYFNKKIEPFVFNNTHFHPIFQKNTCSKIERYFSRLFLRKNNNHIDIQELLKIVEFVQPDLIHVHGTEENFGLIQNQTKIPVIISIQGILSSIVEKFYAGIPASITNRNENYKNKILLKSANYNFKNLTRKAICEREILKISKNIIGRTDFDKRVTRILAPKSEYFIGQEILRPLFYSSQWSKAFFNKKICIVSILSDSTYKGFETILKTTNVLSTYPNFSFEWSIAGINDQSNITSTSENWLNLNSKNLNIKLLGGLDEQKVIDLLISSDIFCQVSHIENSPNSLCEAMILGVPSIATFAGGTSSMMENGKEGIVIQDGDPYVLAGAILEISSDFYKACEYGKNARVRALKRHDKDIIAHNLINIYKTLING
jgi:glycosyltransferase involved in cell wall biosynthesis